MSLENLPSFLRKFSEGDVQDKNGHFYEFKSFRLNLAERQLLQGEKTVSLTPKAFDVLAVLVERSGHLVEKEELMQLVWPDSFVEESNVARIIHTLRRTLGEDENGNKFIETVPTRGYRFVADVSTINNSAGRVAEFRNSETSLPESVVEPQELKPRRPWSNRLLVALTGLVIIAAAISSYFFVYKRANAGEGEHRSIAVIPFTNSTRDAGLDYLVDGTTDSVINQLTRISGLRVVAPNSTSRYKGTDLDLKAVAHELGVQALLIGDIRQVENQLRINVKLVDPNVDALIWGREWAKDPLDVMATPNEISQAVANSLHVKLTDTDKRILAQIPTENAEAYQIYLQGRFAGQHQTPEALIRSIELNSQAIDRDPQFAIAYSELGMRYVNLGIYFEAPRQMMPKARAYAEKALELDPTLSDPHAILGLVALLYDWDVNKARAELANGSVVNLKSMETFSCTAHVLQLTGRTSDADETLHHAIDDDPISVALTTELACNSYYAGRYDDSIKQYQEALMLGPNNFMAVYGLARTLNYERQFQNAIDELDKAKSFMPMLPPIAIAEESYSLAKMGKREEAEAALNKLIDQSQDHFVDPFFMATIYLGLDDKEQTFAWLDKAYQARSSLMPSLVRDAKWDEIRDDERFQKLMIRIGDTTIKPVGNL
jgi:DNA-binding winged helix-turn-helix (wHTH) protein/TolB-like protein